jgi:inorganic pyrophosphatase
MAEPLREVLVVIEVPRFGMVKRELAPGGGFRVDYVSPIPCPFNYGAVPAEAGADGDPVDAVVLGPRLAAGTVTNVAVWGRVLFEDAGKDDHKLICGERPPGPGERLALGAFFRAYAIVRRGLNLAKGLPGRTAFEGLELAPGAGDSNRARVWTGPLLAEAQLVADSLRSAGLHPRVAGEHRPSIAGEIPIPDARVEVWVPAAEGGVARSLLADIDARARGPDWTCARCGEANPPNFASCWSCQGPRTRPDPGSG